MRFRPSSSPFSSYSHPSHSVSITFPLRDTIWSLKWSLLIDTQKHREQKKRKRRRGEEKERERARVLYPLSESIPITNSHWEKEKRLRWRRYRKQVELSKPCTISEHFHCMHNSMIQRWSMARRMIIYNALKGKKLSLLTSSGAGWSFLSLEWSNWHGSEYNCHNCSSYSQHTQNMTRPCLQYHSLSIHYHILLLLSIFIR